MARILVIDDDLGILEVVKIILEEEGHLVETISDSEEIVENIKSRGPDLILLDIWMPGMSGKEVCRRLKEDSKTAKTPIIMLSASLHTEEVCRDCGANDWLAKPFEMNELINKVKEVLT